MKVTVLSMQSSLHHSFNVNIYYKTLHFSSGLHGTILLQAECLELSNPCDNSNLCQE